MNRIKFLVLSAILTVFSIQTSAQHLTQIDTATVRKHLYMLASDDMEGRKSGTRGIEKAASYIENEFKKIGLTTYDTLTTFRQHFDFRGINMFNVIGVLEGRSKKDEYVIISAHYDHLGTKKSGEGDIIFNGANDNASGVTGVLTLAAYFANKKQNERMSLLGNTCEKYARDRLNDFYMIRSFYEDKDLEENENVEKKIDTIKKNNTESVTTQRILKIYSDSNARGGNINAFFEANGSSDYFTFQAYQSSGGAKNLLGTNGGENNYFGGFLVAT